MHKTIEPKTHGVIDYLAAALLLLAPMLFNFGGVAASLSYVLGIAVFALSIITRYPLGLAKVVPFKVHGYIELAAGVFLILAPFLFGFTEQSNAMWFFVIAGATLAVFYMLSDYSWAPRSEPLIRQRRTV